MNSNEPLGLPRGSVRAILALLAVGGTLLANIALLFQGREVDPALLGVGTLVLGYYFGQRQAEGVREEPLPAPALGDED